MGIQVGKKAPAFRLPDAKGREVALADFAGRDVVVWFYPKDMTPGCTKEACAFRDLWPKLKRRAALVGISPDKPERHVAFIEAHDLPFPLLADPERKVLTAYGAYGEKMMYGKKVMGVIRSTVWIGPDGKVKKHWPLVRKAAEHPAEVIAALKDEA